MECEASNGAGLFLVHQYNEGIYADKAKCENRMQQDTGNSSFVKVWERWTADVKKRMDDLKSSRCARHSVATTQLKFVSNTAGQCGALYAGHMYFLSHSPIPHHFTSQMNE